MAGNPNKLDTFVCRVCGEENKQDFFFTYETIKENGVDV
jgi:hypothetical protein